MLNSFGSPFDSYSPYQPYPQQPQVTNYYPGNGAIVNSQVTDARPGYVTVSQSTVHHPSGESWQWVGRPDTNPSYPSYPSYPNRPQGSFFPQSPGMNFYPGNGPIINSQVTEVHPGFVTFSQSSNDPSVVSW